MSVPLAAPDAPAGQSDDDGKHDRDGDHRGDGARPVAHALAFAAPRQQRSVRLEVRICSLVFVAGGQRAGLGGGREARRLRHHLHAQVPQLTCREGTPRQASKQHWRAVASRGGAAAAAVLLQWWCCAVASRITAGRLWWLGRGPPTCSASWCGLDVSGKRQRAATTDPHDNLPSMADQTGHRPGRAASRSEQVQNTVTQRATAGLRLAQP